MKKNIALVTGGYSGESVISYQSAETVLTNVDREKFNLYYIDITVKGWFYKDLVKKEITPVDVKDFSIISDGKKINFDAVLMCIHGTPGEDGKLQGYFDMLGIPYTTCDATSSAVTFNKRFAIAAVAFAGKSVAKSVHLFRNRSLGVQEVLDVVRLPVLVKPNAGGSSIGMSFVDKAADLEGAIKKAFDVDEQVLIEEFISGREFTVGVIRAEGKITVLPITEVVKKNSFFDYQSKYHGENMEVTPADIDESIKSKVEQSARDIYDILNCRGVVRIDFIYNDKNQTPYFLEVNTVPGQSKASLIPQQLLAMGWSLKDFYTTLIENAFL